MARTRVAPLPVVRDGQVSGWGGRCPACLQPSDGMCSGCKAAWRRAGPPVTTLDMMIWTALRARRATIKELRLSRVSKQGGGSER